MDEDFDLFWKPYPKKVNKKKCRMEWDKAEKNGELPSIDVILNGLFNQLSYKTECAKKGVWTPEWPDPERYVKYARWEDEVSDETDKSNIKQSPAQRAAAKRFEAGGGEATIKDITPGYQAC